MNIDTISFHAMGTKIFVGMESNLKSVSALKQVPAWFEEWEQCLSRFRPNSELSRLNRSNGKSFHASLSLCEVVQLSIQAGIESNGLVTPVILDQMEASGYDRSFETFSENKAVTKNLDYPVADVSEIFFEPASRTIRLPRNMRLDLGGFGKGWAAQKAMRRLARIAPTLVDAGGDIAISSTLSDGSPWPVGVENAIHPEVSQVVLSLGKNSVATSGRNRRYWLADGQLRHHIIDPRTNRPALTDIVTATIINKNLTHAEMASKAVFIQGSQAGMQWLEDHPAYSGILSLENGRILTTPGFEKHIWSEHVRQ